jgi:hypothetical protein
MTTTPLITDGAFAGAALLGLSPFELVPNTSALQLLYEAAAPVGGTLAVALLAIVLKRYLSVP